MRGLFVAGGVAAFLGLVLGCAPKPATPPPAAEPAPPPKPPPQPPPKSDVQDDRVDLAQLNSIIEDWHRAWKGGNKALERQTDTRLKRWIKQELAEDQKQVGEANREAAKSSQSKNAHAAADDRKDAQKAEGEASRTRKIAMQLRNIQDRFDDGTAGEPMYTKKSELLRDLQGIAQAELARSRQERAEDKQQATGSPKPKPEAKPEPEPKPKPKPKASSGGGGGDKEASGGKDAQGQVIGPKKLITAINQWIKGRNEGNQKLVRDADNNIKLWWKQELARERPWTPRSKEIAQALKKMQPAFNKNEATPAQWKKKKELLQELKKIANARAGGKK